MPLKHLRVCEPCADRVRWAPCGPTCHLPVEVISPDEWRENLQYGAGQMLQARTSA